MVTDPLPTPVTLAVDVPVETTVATDGLLLVQVAALLTADPFEFFTVSVRLCPMRIVLPVGVTTNPCGDAAGASKASFGILGGVVGISPQLAIAIDANDSTATRADTLLGIGISRLKVALQYAR